MEDEDIEIVYEDATPHEDINVSCNVLQTIEAIDTGMLGTKEKNKIFLIRNACISIPYKQIKSIYESIL
jgi:hypothetical protein